MPTRSSELEAIVTDMIEMHPLVGLAVGIVRDGSLEFFRSHGSADRETSTPISEDTIFRIASITKTFTAIAVMQLYERGLVDLDAPANEYLRAYQLVPVDPEYRAATVRHLLTHTAGLSEVAHPDGVLRPDFGESFPAGETMPTLAEFYRGVLRVQADPGSRFVYNNHGPATLGQIVADVSGSALEDYFRDHIFTPLGMTGSSLVRTDLVRAQLATGYEINSRGTTEVDERDMVTAGAASIYSSPRDMSRYVAALVGQGSNMYGSILKPDTLAMMFEPHWQPDPRVPGMGLGFFLASFDGHRVVRHQGTHPGFHSEMAVAPEDGVGVIAFTNGAHHADFWLPPAGGRLLRSAIGIASDYDPEPAPSHPEVWSGICGWYRLDAGVADVRLRGMMGFGAEVFVRNSKLMLRFLAPIPALARGFELEPDDPTDPYVFRIDLGDQGMDPIRVISGRGADGTPQLYLDLMPLILEKQPEASNPRRWAARVTAVLGAVAAVGVAVQLRRSNK